MSAGWQVGDLALCVSAGKIKCPNPDPKIGSHLGKTSPPQGSVREVAEVQPALLDSGRQCGCVALAFVGGGCAITQRCIKISPPAADEFDRETIALTNRVEQPA